MGAAHFAALLKGAPLPPPLDAAEPPVNKGPELEAAEHDEPECEVEEGAVPDRASTSAGRAVTCRAVQCAAAWL